MTVNMLERGSDPLVRAGQKAKVVVDLEGENDGSCERVEVQLVLNHRVQVWTLGALEPTPGHHELEVEIPVDAPPSSPWTRYTFKGILHRTKGTPSDGVSLVQVIGDPAHVVWPEGPRAGSDDAGLVVSLDTDSVDAGGTVSGRVVGTSDKPVKVSVGPVSDQIVGVEGKPNGVRKIDYKPIAEADLGPDGAFRFEIPAGAPPNVHDGEHTWIWWEVRAEAGKTTAWQRFALLDPEGKVTIPETRPAGLLDLFY